MFTKTIASAGWDFGELDTALIRISSRGLVGADYGQLVKRAGDEFAHLVKNAEHLPGEVWAHNIALGETERFGPNRNGDGFKRATCAYAHPTFVKFAKIFRHHVNRPTSPSYGRIAASHHDPDMGRIELLMAYNATKEAAERNGGEHGRVADEEIAKLDRGEPVATSMSCRIPFDTCSGCGNRARTRAEYCGPECKYGGCRDNLSKAFEDGHVLHVDNPPESVFFDNSGVFRGADRTAFTLGKLAAYEELTKAAADGRPVSGAEWAERLGVAAPPVCPADLDPLLAPRLVPLVKAAHALAAAEGLPAPGLDALAFAPSVFAAGDLPPGVKAADALSALAADGRLLPFADFLAAVGKVGREKAGAVAHAAKPLLRAAFGRFAAGPAPERAFAEAAAFEFPTPTAAAKHWAAKHAAALGVAPADLRRRAVRAAVTGPGYPAVKVAYDTALLERLADSYVAYQVALCAAQPSERAMLTQNACLIHNSAP
jgi:hypothetical protein